MKVGRIVDLTHTLYPGREEYKLELKTFFTEELLPQYRRKPEEWYILTEVAFMAHVGTHVELPYHHVKTGKDAADFPLEQLVGQAVILDFRYKQKGETIEIGELMALEDKIREGDIVFIKTGLDVNYRTERAHDRPCVSQEAIKWLVSKKIKCLGIDCSGIEPAGVEGQPNHLMLLENGIPLIEYLAHLDQLTKERVLVFILPLKITGLESSPVRVIAVEEETS